MVQRNTFLPMLYNLLLSLHDIKSNNIHVGANGR